MHGADQEPVLPERHPFDNESAACILLKPRLIMHRILQRFLVFCVACEGEALVDAGTSDTGPTSNTGTDSGVSVDAETTMDAGSELDGGAPEDVGPSSDSGVTTDSGVVTDGGVGDDAEADDDGGGVEDSGVNLDAGTPPPRSGALAACSSLSVSTAAATWRSSRPETERLIGQG